MSTDASVAYEGNDGTKKPSNVKKATKVKDAIRESDLTDQSRIWSLEDIALLARDLESLAETVTSLQKNIGALTTLVVSLESRVAQIPITNTKPIPVDVISGMSPAQLYHGAIQGALIAAVLSRPQVLDKSEFRKPQIDKILEFAEEVLHATMARWGLKARK